MTLQTVVDAREDLNIRAYAIWSGWQQEHALAEIEGQLRGEGVEFCAPRLSPFGLAEPRREWPLFWISLAAFAFGGLVGLRFL